GAHALSHEDLPLMYETKCDPRLNASQSVELAFMLSERLSDFKRSVRTQHMTKHVNGTTR
ncbi:3-deoxy-7-phosphoheptulonate synthase, partial [Aeromonas veronii]|uniref:3-deoxy-7-phosphoheptulonate synthase n=3 Tax=Pseudomonadota TaxID=1224 RepID=UPI00406D499B